MTTHAKRKNHHATLVLFEISQVSLDKKSITLHITTKVFSKPCLSTMTS